ncbi:MAG: methyltransferase domain-containing protein [Acidimicrobiia bacterium]|nr:methyltransferase domain-containing protein [Acidimicrobiia bacterium]
MGVYADHVLPRLTDLTLRSRPIEQLRQRVTAGLDGEVLEVGFGSGRNVPYYPAGVRRVRAVEPSGVGRRLAADRVASSPVPVEYVGLDGADLALDDATIDHVLTTWTLCTIPDLGRALAEIRRVLRPGGALHFLEHGRAPDLGVARWQDRLTPLQRRFCGGCHLNRPIDDLVRGARLDVARLETFYLKGPKPFGYVYEGMAMRP